VPVVQGVVVVFGTQLRVAVVAGLSLVREGVGRGAGGAERLVPGVVQVLVGWVARPVKGVANVAGSSVLIRLEQLADQPWESTGSVSTRPPSRHAATPFTPDVAQGRATQ
jgi:hypothetical protein